MVIRYGESLWPGKPKPGEGVMVRRINPTGGGVGGKNASMRSTQPKASSEVTRSNTKQSIISKNP